MASLSSDNTKGVFIDTNLDTHFATDVSVHDTVWDLKKRIKSEHPSQFPKFGPINIHAIKVKRKGCFYQLVDSMCVRVAFNGSKKSWFLSVEASALGEGAKSDQLVPHASPNQVASLDNLQLLQLENKQGEGQGIHNVSPCVSEQTDRGAVKNLKASVKLVGNNEDGIPVHGSIPEAEERDFVNREVLPSLHIQCEVDGSVTSIKDVCDVREDDLPISVPSSNRKRRSKMKRRRAQIKELKARHLERPGKGKRTICNDSGVTIAAGKSCKKRRTDTLNTKDGALSCLSGGVTIDYLPDNNSSGPDAGIFNKKRSTTGGSDENELIKSTTLFVEDTPLVPQTSIDRSSSAEKSKDCDQKIEHAATTDQKLCSLTIPCDNLASGTLIPMDQELPGI
ncbi:uncharacterized protein LOC130737529 isoform X2 [Lotus japonicus]|uniref:uncharacterized protein LOC130737529 isoform X2 n=1 Tax=Lotus japonicus TaxID=34305 RepID=UPI0025832C0E|nr:uncharacterized protein LOC130737529 isoform X2 [Lotus japonicus]